MRGRADDEIVSRQIVWQTRGYPAILRKDEGKKDMSVEV